MNRNLKQPDLSTAMASTSNKRQASAWLPTSLRGLFTVLMCWVFLISSTFAATVEVTYIHTDTSGSPMAATDAAGTILWRESYRGYGERWMNQPASYQQNQWFHGKELDATGMQYFGARYYDPEIGRFTGIDPVGFQEGNLHSFNRFAYGNNNPVKYLDPDGNLPIFIPFLIAATAQAARIAVTRAAVATVVNAPRIGILAAEVGAGEALGGASVVGGVTAVSAVAPKLVSASKSYNFKSAEAAADAALEYGRVSGAAAELRVGNHVFTGVSGEMVFPASRATGVLMGTPGKYRAPWHGGCAEIVCIDKALNAGIDPTGGTIRAVNIGISGNGHNTAKIICPSCNFATREFGIKAGN